VSARPLRIGLTGGIASGKSTVAARFAELGVPVIDADAIAREVVEPGTALLDALLARFSDAARARFGQPLRRADGALDRALLRRLVFEDAAQRHALEALLHPAIQVRAEQLAAQAGGPSQVHVVPLLAESNARSRFDRVLVVDCPEELQRARLQRRDGISLEQAQAMLDAQASRAERLAIADDVILNDDGTAALAAPIAALHQRYLRIGAFTRPDSLKHNS
jgi:dephospho-CoA kinase